MATSSPHTKKVVEIALEAMGGTFIYRAYPQSHLSPENVEELFKDAHKEVKRIQSKFTEFEPSVLTELNEKALLENVSVDEETWMLLMKAQGFFKKSQGIFDISFASFARVWRQALKEERTLSEKDKEKLREKVNFENVILDPKNRTVSFKEQGLFISFGGMGKGYAVDQAFDLLRSKGMVNFSVNGSGDMRVHATDDAPRPWRIGIRNPFAKDPQQSAGMVQVRNGGVSTSGSYIQYNKTDKSGRDHHVLNFYEDHTSPPPVSVTIVGETSLESDVWATICLAVDTPKAYQLMVENDLYGIIIDKEGKTLLSPKALKNFQ